MCVAHGTKKIIVVLSEVKDLAVQSEREVICRVLHSSLCWLEGSKMRIAAGSIAVRDQIFHRQLEAVFVC